MRTFLFCFCIIAGMLHTSAEVPQWDGVSGESNCLDSISLKKNYMDGNLDHLYNKMQNYRVSITASGGSIPLPCWTPVAKYTAVTALALKQDTATSQIYFASLLKADPSSQIFDLGVTLGIQSLFDQTRIAMGIQESPEEMFRLRLIPPPAFGPSPNKRVEGMKNKIHDLRSIYALANDSASFIIVANALRGETDPAFRLFAADLMTVAGAPLKRAGKMVDESANLPSEIMASNTIEDWAYRLKIRVSSMEAQAIGPGTPAMHTTFGDGKPKKPVRSTLTIKDTE